MSNSRGKPDSNYHSGEKNTECYFCGCGPPLREHHIIPQRFGGPDTAENIVELCDLCHKRIERLYDKSFYEWFGIKDETGERTFHRSCADSSCGNTADLKIRVPWAEGHRWNTELLCFRCANRSYSEHEEKYVIESDTVERFLVTPGAWDQIEERRIKVMEDYLPVDEDGNLQESIADSWRKQIRENRPIQNDNIYDIDRSKITLSDKDIREIGIGPLQPKDADGKILTRFEIMEEFVLDHNDRVTDHFRTDKN